ncbi:MAG: NYN domain-containing protein [Nocardioidaceae bacterium]
MSDQARVAVYLDFDNVVISCYDLRHGDGAWRRDNARQHAGTPGSTDPIDVRLHEAEVDIGAIIDYASSFGAVALTRAYADWSAPANAAYRRQLVDRAVDLIQLFTTSGMKNGADIRLSIDAISDLNQHEDITHVVVVAGDSDYVALAQRCKQMGRFVVGIGVARSTSRALVAACDDFTDYSRLPGLAPQPLASADGAGVLEAPAEAKTAKKAAAGRSAKKQTTKKAAKRTPTEGDESGESSSEDAAATALLLRAIRIGLEKSDDEWIHGSGVKSQMQRMDSTFKEKSLGYSSFRSFVESRADVVETEVRDNGQLLVRLRTLS